MSVGAALPEAGAPAPLRPNLVGMDRDDLEALVADLGEPRFRAKQLFQWIYHKGSEDFAAMTNLGKALRAKLAEGHRIARPAVTADLLSTDGTRKWLLKFDDGNEAEMVFIPEEDRGTLCISSQVGCTLTCTFCHTGTQRLVRNLTPAEIVGQVMLARDRLDEWPSANDNRRITNIVLMGMGEPLYNTENVTKAMKIVMDGDGIGISKRRITLSTSGVVPEMHKVGAEIGCLLAISLHAVTDELRDVLVPINRKYPLKELIQACRDYPTLKNSNRITFEYVMLKGVNDSPADAKALLALIKGIPAKINLIPFNLWPGAPYECSDDAAIDAFAKIIWNAGYSSPVRTPRGRDIMAACGQLKSESLRQRKARRTAAT